MYGEFSITSPFALTWVIFICEYSFERTAITVIRTGLHKDQSRYLYWFPKAFSFIQKDQLPLRSRCTELIRFMPSNSEKNPTKYIL